MTLSGLLLPLVLLAAYGVFVWFLWRDTFGMAHTRRGPRERPPLPAIRLMNARERVLFVCTHNSARSQMAEALLRHAAPTRFIVASAGTAPTRVHPFAAEVMAERGLRLASHEAKALADVGPRWDYVITVCDDAYEKCPEFPAKTSRLHWSIRDPVAAVSEASDPLDGFRRVREEQSTRIEQWLSDRPERP